MKDNYNGVNMATWKMLEAFNVFTQAMQETLRPQVEAEYSFGPEEEEESEDEMEGKLIASSDEAEDDYECDDEFPGRQFFSIEDIDSEDPAFAFGKEIGIPKDVAVYNSRRQNKFIGMI